MVGKKDKEIRARPSSPPPFRAMPEKKHSFLQEVFPYHYHHHFHHHSPGGGPDDGGDGSPGTHGS